MKNRSLLLAALCGGALAASPSLAGDFAVAPSYWDTDAAGETAGGGFILGLPFNEVIGAEFRATYYEELTDDPLAAAFDSDDPVFQERGIQVMPLEAGLRFSFAPGAAFRPYLGGGASYFLLDSDFGEISDELGYYAALGASIGDGDGADFFVEGTWRKATAEVELDPQDLEDVDDLDVDEHADVDLDGLGVNLGVRFSF